MVLPFLITLRHVVHSLCHLPAHSGNRCLYTIPCQILRDTERWGNLRVSAPSASVRRDYLAEHG